HEVAERLDEISKGVAREGHGHELELRQRRLAVAGHLREREVRAARTRGADPPRGAHHPAPAAVVWVTTLVDTYPATQGLTRWTQRARTVRPACSTVGAQ